MALWSGRFTEGADAFTQRFGASLPVDQRLYAEDIAGSIAHANMLAAQGIKVEHSRIKVEPAIKTLGKFEVDVKLHSDVAAKLSVWVVRG